MQLFVLDRNPAVAAQMLCDVHLRKMCLETAQILSAVIIIQGKDLHPDMPRICNAGHPVIRALNTPYKINWTILYNYSLHREYHYRFKKQHRYRPLCRIYGKMLYTKYTANIFDESFCRNFKDHQITIPDIVEAYREYYRCKKLMISRWTYTRRSEPAWLTSENS